MPFLILFFFEKKKQGEPRLISIAIRIQDQNSRSNALPVCLFFSEQSYFGVVSRSVVLIRVLRRDAQATQWRRVAGNCAALHTCKQFQQNITYVVRSTPIPIQSSTHCNR
jgi:hypothetical protein